MWLWFDLNKFIYFCLCYLLILGFECLIKSVVLVGYLELVFLGGYGWVLGFLFDYILYSIILI